MDKHTFIGKRKVGSTEICDFTDYQGIGHDPLYKRYESVRSVVRRVIAPPYVHFLAAPDYAPEDDAVNWYINQWSESPVRLATLKGEERERYTGIKERTLNHYREVLQTLSGEDLQIMACALRYVDDEFIYCCDGKVYLLAWGMTPDVRRHVPKGELVHESTVVARHKVSFNAGEHGSVPPLATTVSLPEGTALNANDIPQVTPQKGYKFDGWTPDPMGWVVNSDTEFSACYSRIEEPVAPPACGA